jgi:hypothetical protein
VQVLGRCPALGLNPSLHPTRYRWLREPRHAGELKRLAVTSSGAYNSRMSKYDDLEKQARALSRREKAALARILIGELDPVSDPGVEELWLDEARRRYDPYLRGEMQSHRG